MPSKTDIKENVAKGRIGVAHSKSPGVLGLTKKDRVNLLKKAAKELVEVQKERQNTDSNNE